MTIEDALGSIAESLHRIADIMQATAGGAAPAPVVSQPAATADEGLSPQQKAAQTRARNKAAKAAEGGEGAAPADAPPAAIDRDALKAKLTEVTNELGRDAVVALFQRFGVPNLKGLPEDQYPAAYDMAARALTEGVEVITGSN